MTDTAIRKRNPGERPFRIGLLVLPDCNLLSMAAALDPFRAANRRAGKALYDWQVLSPQGGMLSLTCGVEVKTDPLPLNADMDLLVMVAGFRLDANATPALRAWLRQLRGRKISYCGVDGGPWVLARAGLLNGHCATTHWEDLEAFSIAFPDVEPLPDRFVIDGPALTTGGAAPCLDLMLHLIRAHHGAELAGQVANALLYDPADRPTPQRLVPQARLAAVAPPVAQAVTIMEDRMEEPPAMAAIARQVGLSARRLEMLFRQHLEIGPGTFFLRLRLNEARRLALDTGLTVQEIAVRTGFSGPSTLARAFRKAFGQSVSDLRAGR
ncbi:GlxA family transcriptional regulator [Nioella nitratireducens]|uniref:GlxA family transcriptional regulator n=1 Tax=Nioella nitratireducens TaxID=1287720 RepID=UPI0008FCF6E1|nr:GlxA family transcriptional regulator [Nioella nitratireducens]